MLAGVCGGLGRYLGMDPTLVRVLYALGAFFTAIVPGIIVYIILALVIPEDRARP
jgi:phage shock protein C